MSVRIAARSLLVLGLLLGGCTPSPEKLCSHLKDLEKDKRADTGVDHCMSNVQKAKDKNPDEWSACSKCAIDAATSKDFAHCLDPCHRR